MARFKADKGSHKALHIIMPLVAFALVLGIFCYFVNAFSASSYDKQRDTLEAALNDSIAYCYAMEGAYPESLQYIKDNYGLTYNEELFYVDYQVQGSNIHPVFTIINKEESDEIK